MKRVLGHWREISRKNRKLPDHATYRVTEAAIGVVGGVNGGAVEAGAVGVRCTVDRARPVVTVATATVQRAAVDVASADKEQG